MSRRTIVTTHDLATNDGMRLLGQLLDVDLWSVRSFAADVRIHFDERGVILRAELLNPAPPVGGSDTPADQPEPELQERVEYGHQTVELGWVPEHRGIKYASHQRTVYWRADPPLLIDHWSDPQPAPADQPECAEHAEERAAVKAWCGLDGGNGKGYGTSLGHVESAREYDARHEAHHNARPVLADQGEKP